MYLSYYYLSVTHFSSNANNGANAGKSNNAN
jgi:hypothetical protein